MLLSIVIYISTISAGHSQTTNYGSTVVSPQNIVKNVLSWLYYERDYMVWSADYIALDTSFSKISKEDFLKSLCSGKYYPVKLLTKDASLCYQLYLLETSKV